MTTAPVTMPGGLVGSFHVLWPLWRILLWAKFLSSVFRPPARAVSNTHRFCLLGRAVPGYQNTCPLPTQSSSAFSLSVSADPGLPFQHSDVLPRCFVPTGSHAAAQSHCFSVSSSGEAAASLSVKQAGKQPHSLRGEGSARLEWTMYGLLFTPVWK